MTLGRKAYARAHLDELVERALEPLLGRHTAARALRLAAGHLNRRPEELRPTDAHAVCEFLTPMLRTLVGKSSTSVVIENIQREASEGAP